VTIAQQRRYMQVAVLPWCYDMDMGTANLLYASAKHGKYNERFGKTLAFH